MAIVEVAVCGGSTVLIFPSCEPLPAVPIAEFMQPQEEEQMLGNVL